jgi:hypothetical protein
MTRRSPTALAIAVVVLATSALACVASGTANDDDTSTTTTTTGDGQPHDCGAAGSNSHETPDGTCVCDAGHAWVHPNDDDDFTCEEIGDTSVTPCDGPHNVIMDGNCFCEQGYEWCDPSSPDDLSCCGHGSSGTDTGGVDTSGSETAGDTGVEPDPADCSDATEGSVFCSNTAAMGPEGSRFWTCTGGTWVEDPTAVDLQCGADGYDFGYGCFDDGEAIVYLCGNGPGTACGDETAPMCVDDDVIHACFFGKLTEDGCSTVCSTIGDDAGITYDSGYCDAEAMPVDCVCCNAGDEGCPA